MLSPLHFLRFNFCLSLGNVQLGIISGILWKKPLAIFLGQRLNFKIVVHPFPFDLSGDLKQKSLIMKGWVTHVVAFFFWRLYGFSKGLASCEGMPCSSCLRIILQGACLHHNH